MSPPKQPSGQISLDKKIDVRDLKIHKSESMDDDEGVKESLDLDHDTSVESPLIGDKSEPGKIDLIPAAWGNPSPVPSDDFPHVNPATLKPLPTLENFAFMLNFYRIRVTYNVISKRVDIVIPELKGSPDNIENAALAIIISLANLNHINAGNVMMYIGAVANKNSYNPIQEWIGSKAWDGTDRIGELAATLVLAEDYPLHLRDKLIRRWLLSAGAAAID